MRLIDADVACKGCVRYGTDLSCENCVVNDAPTIDAVPMVRCRECKHWVKDVAGCTDFVGRCDLANYMIGANGYCLYGERKGCAD